MNEQAEAFLAYGEALRKELRTGMGKMTAILKARKEAVRERHEASVKAGLSLKQEASAKAGPMGKTILERQDDIAQERGARKNAAAMGTQNKATTAGAQPANKQAISPGLGASVAAAQSAEEMRAGRKMTVGTSFNLPGKSSPAVMAMKDVASLDVSMESGKAAAVTHAKETRVGKIQPMDMTDSKRMAWLDRCEGRNIPRRVWDLVSGGFDENSNAYRETEAIRAIITQASRGKRFLVISGPPGTGKTVALAYLLTCPEYKFTHGGHIGTFTHAGRDLVDGYGRPHKKLLGRVPVVAIDDLGTEPARVSAVVDEILQQRYENNLHTFCTTNLAARDFTQRYDKRTISRLMEVGDFVTVGEVVRPGKEA